MTNPLTKDQMIQKIMTKARQMTKPQLKRLLAKLDKKQRIEGMQNPNNKGNPNNVQELTYGRPIWKSQKEEIQKLINEMKQIQHDIRPEKKSLMSIFRKSSNRKRQTQIEQLMRMSKNITRILRKSGINIHNFIDNEKRWMSTSLQNELIKNYNELFRYAEPQSKIEELNVNPKTEKPELKRQIESELSLAIDRNHEFAIDELTKELKHLNSKNFAGIRIAGVYLNNKGKITMPANLRSKIKRTRPYT